MSSGALVMPLGRRRGDARRMTAPLDDDILDGLRNVLRQHGGDPEAAARAFAAVARTLATGYARAVCRQQRRAAIRLVRDRG